jgi:type VI secretion system protein ImpF
LDENPGVATDPPAQESKSHRDLRRSVRRDVENLLNTRQRALSWPKNMQELDCSLLSYGIPDFAAINLGSAEGRDEVRRVLELTIRRNEPRFQNIKITLLDNVEPLDRGRRFRIEAPLRVEPTPEPVTFDSVLEPVTGNFELKGRDRD